MSGMYRSRTIRFIAQMGKGLLFPSLRGSVLGILALALTLGLTAQSGAQVQRFFVVDSDHQVYRYNESYAPTTSWSTNAANSAESDVFVTNTYVYVLDNTDNQIYRYSYSGGTPTASRPFYNTTGSSLVQNRAFAIWGDDLWVADDSTTLYGIYKYSLTDAFNGTSNYGAVDKKSLGQGGAAGNTQAQGLAADANYVYTYDLGTGRAYRYGVTTSAIQQGSVLQNESGGSISSSNGSQGISLEGSKLRVIFDSSGAQDTVYEFDSIDALFANPANPVHANRHSDLTGYSGANDDSKGIGFNPIPVVSSIALASPNPTNAASVNFTVTFSESVSNVDAADFALAYTPVYFTVAPSIASVTGSGNTWTVTVNTGTGQGTIGLNFVDNDSVTDIGNLPVGGTNGTPANYTGPAYNFDNVVPTVAVAGPASPTNANPITFTITFSEPVAGLTADEISVSGGSKGLLGGGPIAYSLPVTPSAQGPVTCQVPAGAAQDIPVGNTNTASNIASVSYDSINPTVVSINRQSPLAQNTNWPFVTWRVTFSEPVKNVDTTDFTLTDVGGSINGEVVSGISSSVGDVIDVIVNTGVSGDGLLRLDMVAASATIADNAGNALVADHQGDESYTLDKTPPAVASINRQTPPGQNTNLGTVTWRVTFSEDVNNVTPGAFSLVDVGNSITGEALTGLSVVSARIYDVTASAGSGDGTLRLDLPVSPGITDNMGNAMTVGFTTGQTFIIDRTSPAVLLGSPVGAYTNTSFTVTATFYEPVTDFSLADVTISNGGLGANFAVVSPSVYTWTVVPQNQGTLQIQVLAGVAADLAGNPNTASNTFVTNYETVAPSIVARVPAAGATILSLPTVSVTFSESVTNVTAGLLTVNGSPAASVGGSGAGPYVFSGYADPADGAVDVSVASGAIRDLADNAFAGGAWTYDKNTTALTATIDSVVVSNGGSTNQGPVAFSVAFSEPVQNFVIDDVTISSGTTGNFGGSDDHYTFEVTASQPGDVSIRIPASVADSILVPGKMNSASSLYTYTYDLTQPTVALTPEAGSVPLANAAFNVTALFSEPMKNFDMGDVTVSNAAITNFAGAGATYSWTITPIAQGPLQVNILAGVATDLAGNGNLASSIIATTYDSIHPGLTFSSIAPNPTNGSPIPVTATFNEDVTGFGISDIHVTNGSANGFAQVTSGVYTFSVSPSGPDVNVSIDAPAQSAFDAAGNGNSAAPTFSIRYDSVGPAPSVVGPASPSRLNPINFTVTFNEPVHGFDLGGLTVTGGLAAPPSGSGAGPYTVTVTPSASGLVSCRVNPGAVHDDAGNINTYSAQAAVTYDRDAPIVTSVLPVRGAAQNSLPSVSVVFNEAVMGVSAGDLRVNGSEATAVSGSGAGPYIFAGFTAPGAGLATVSLYAASITDVVGNSFTGDGWNYTIDPDAPLISQTVPAQGDALTSLVAVAVTFTKPVVNVRAEDLVVSGSQATTVTGSGAGPYTFTGFAAPAEEITFDVALGPGTIQDQVGNPFSRSEWTYTIDVTSPVVQSVHVQGPLSVNVVFSEPIADGALNPANYAVSGSGRGSLPVHPASVTVIDGYTRHLSWASGKMHDGGDITITVQNVFDTPGNPLGDPNSGTHVGGGVGILPSVIVTRMGGQPQHTNILPAWFSVTFSEDVDSLTTSGVVVDGTIGANASVTVTKLTNSTYRLKISSSHPKESCTIIPRVAAGAAVDAVGNPNTDSVNTDNNVEYEYVSYPASDVKEWEKY